MLFCVLCIYFLPSPPETQMELKAEGTAVIYAKTEFVAVFVKMQDGSTQCLKLFRTHWATLTDTESLAAEP